MSGDGEWTRVGECPGTGSSAPPYVLSRNVHSTWRGSLHTNQSGWALGLIRVPPVARWEKWARNEGGVGG